LLAVMGWAVFGPLVEREIVRYGAKTHMCRIAGLEAVGFEAAGLGASELDECRINLLTA
jgi:hypothetical protein